MIELHDGLTLAELLEKLLEDPRVTGTKIDQLEMMQDDLETGVRIGRSAIGWARKLYDELRRGTP